MPRFGQSGRNCHSPFEHLLDGGVESDPPQGGEILAAENRREACEAQEVGQIRQPINSLGRAAWLRSTWME